MARAFLIGRWRDREAMRHEHEERAWLVTCHCTLAPHCTARRPLARPLGSTHCSWCKATAACSGNSRRSNAPGSWTSLKTYFFLFARKSFHVTRETFFKLHASSNSHAVSGLRMDEAQDLSRSQDLFLHWSPGPHRGMCCSVSRGAETPQGRRARARTQLVRGHPDSPRGPQPP